MVELNKYVLRFSGNGNTSGNVPITQSAETEDSTYSFTIPADNNLLKTNYGFIGWSENPAQATTAEYQPGSIINLTKDKSQITLYAIWYPGLLALTNMQEMVTDICKISSSVGDSKPLIDTRDGKEYWVTKLKDGNCWMTQNLDFDLKQGVALTDADSDFSESSVKNWTPDINEGTITVALTNDSWPITNNIVRSWDPALGKEPTYCNNGTTAGACKTSGNPTTSVNNGHDAQGNYYSWGAATAGEASILTSDTTGQESTRSICPKGWRLPVNEDSKGPSFGGLQTAYNISNTGSISINAPIYLTYTGSVSNNKLNNAGTNGHYWSGTGNGKLNTYNLYFHSSEFNPHLGNDRYYGFSVRCVAR